MEGGRVSQEFVLDKVHPVNYILPRFKDLSDVLCIDGSGEVGIAEVAAIMCLHAQFLSKEDKREQGQHDRTAPNQSSRNALQVMWSHL